MKRAETYLEKSVKEGYLRKSGNCYEAEPRYLGTWERVRELLDMLRRHLFESSEPNPMQLKSDSSAEVLAG